MFKRIIKNCLKAFQWNNRNTSEITNIIYVYRYLSWGLPSLAYIMGPPYSFIGFKLGVIISLFLLSKVISDMYIRNHDKSGMLRILVLIETFGITLLLLPTGGLSSPFIWFALNPILVAASFLPVYFSWINLAVFLLAGSAMSYIFFNSYDKYIFSILRDNSNLILTLSLITLIVQMLSNLTKKLIKQAGELEQSNAQKQESINYIMDLYQIIEALNNHNAKEKLIQTLADYTAKLTKSDLCFICLASLQKDDDQIFSSTHLYNSDYKAYIDIIKSRVDINTSKIQEFRIENNTFITSTFFLPTSAYGLIIVKGNQLINNIFSPKDKLLEFISGLCSVTLERFNQEDIEENLIVLEEQNRIANEMHDSVSQRLFSITYAIHGLLGRWGTIPKEELREYLVELNESSNKAMKELRNSIYKLSPKKNGLKSLQITLNEFIKSTSKLHHINIDYQIKGDEGMLSLPLKQGVTRIVREACGNAIRHGKCNSIKIDLSIKKKNMDLIIIDDGKGFSMNSVRLEKSNGLGLLNMRNLVSIFGGSIEFNSEIEEGTQIHIIIPLIDNQIEVVNGGLAV